MAYRKKRKATKKKLRKIPIAKPVTEKTRMGNIRTLRDSNKNAPRRSGKGLKSI